MRLTWGGMDQGDGAGVGEEVVVDLEGVGGHFQDDGVLGREVLLGPGVELGEGDADGAEELVELGVHADGDEIGFVDVEADEAGGGFLFCVHCVILL